MKFMEEEFDRLDTDKNGKINVKELEQSRLWGPSQPFVSAGK